MQPTGQRGGDTKSNTTLMRTTKNNVCLSNTATFVSIFLQFAKLG